MRKPCLLLSSLSLVRHGYAYSWYNIKDQEFSTTVFFQYYDGITTSLKLTTYYSNFSKCSTDGIEALADSVYDYNVIKIADPTYEHKWFEKIADIIATEFSDFYYYCSLTVYQVEEYNQEKWGEFVGINDIYTSFLFNLLEESISIRNTAEDLEQYENDKDWPNFASELATLVYLVLDFESATAASKPEPLEQPEEVIEFFTKPKEEEYMKKLKYKNPVRKP